MSVTLSEVRRAARAHRAPLAGESAGYLVLALADQVLSAPRLIEAGDIQLTDDGALRVLRGQASSESDAELSLRRALDSLLLVASSGSAALTRASRRLAPVGLPGLVRELEAALIPVNRSAARRALARLQRETARALASGTLADEEPEVHLAAPAREVSLPEVSTIEVSTIEVSAPHVVALAASSSHEDPDASVEPSPVSDALTIALEVRPLPDAAAVAETMLLDEDVELIDEEPSEALTVARNLDVQLTSAATEPAPIELPEEACTRPEPVIVRQAMRPLASRALPTPIVEALPRTPTLGSLAAELPVLAPEQIAAMTRREEAEAPAAVEPSPEPAALVLCSAPDDEHTERMPEVLPLSPGVALVASRKSDVSELLASFQVGVDATQQGLPRAIKEMADLDLTPAPFAALIR